MGIGLGEALLIALIAAAVLKPEELSRLAKSVGRWMGEAQKMSRGFMDELKREADVSDLTETARSVKRELDEAMKEPEKLFESPPGQVARGGGASAEGNEEAGAANGESVAPRAAEPAGTQTTESAEGGVPGIDAEREQG